MMQRSRHSESLWVALKMGIKLWVVNTAIYGKWYGVPLFLLSSVYKSQQKL